MNFQTLTADDVCRIHTALVQEFADTDNPISPPGVMSLNLLESAVLRQHVGNGTQIKYPNPIENAATLAYGICCDHAFFNGNKRTALVAMLVHLDKNRLTLINVQQKELFDMILAVATHSIAVEKEKDKKKQRSVTPAKPIVPVKPPVRPSTDDEVQAIANWIRLRVAPITRGEKQITFRQLRHILKQFNYILENPKGNAIDVARVTEERQGLFISKKIVIHKRIGSIAYPGDNEFVPIKYLKQIRAMCGLCEEDGIDSNAFYGDGAIVDFILNRYRTTLRRLANK